MPHHSAQVPCAGPRLQPVLSASSPRSVGNRRLSSQWVAGQPKAAIRLVFAVLDPAKNAAEVQAVRRPTGRGVGLQASACPAEEAQGAGPVAAFGMSDGHAEL